MKRICPGCNNPIPDKKLACPLCTEEAGRKAIRQYQLHPLRKVFEGEGDLTTRAIAGKRHVEMFGGWGRAFCGCVVTTDQRKGHVTWDEDQLKTVCEACRKELIRLMEIACRTSV